MQLEPAAGLEYGAIFAGAAMCAACFTIGRWGGLHVP